MTSEWPVFVASELEDLRILLIQDGNHGEYRPRRDEFVPNGTAFIRAADLDEGGPIAFERASHINNVALGRIRKGIGKPGDVLISHKGTVGRVAVAPLGCEPFVCSPQTTFWRSLDEGQLDRRYLCAYLRSPLMQRQLDAVKHESDMAAYVSLTVQRTLKVLLPSIEEQRRIAGVIGALDDKIEHDRRLAEHLSQTAALAVDRRLAEAEDVVGVYEVATVTYGFAFKSALFGSNGVAILRIRDLKTHDPGVQTSETHAKARLVREGDIVVGMDGEFRAHVWHGPDSWLNQRVCAFDPRPGVSRAYLWRAIQTPLAYVESTETGTTVIHLGKADIDDFELPGITTEAMKRLAAEADAMLELSAHLARQAQSLAVVRDALLPRLVSGQLRIRENYDRDGTLGERASRT